MLWVMPLFAEDLPKHLSSDLFTRAHIQGDQPSGEKSHLLGRTSGRDGGSAHIGPLDPDETSRVFPGTSTTEFTDIDDGVRATIQAVLDTPNRSTAETAIAATVMGRLIGASLAHEIAHTLVGNFLTGPDNNFHTAVANDILLRGSAWTFENMTGFRTTEGFFEDGGVQRINRPQAGGSLDVIHMFFPVPPAFQ